MTGKERRRAGRAPEPAPSPDGKGSGPISIVLADDHAIFRQGLRRVLGEDPRVRVVGEACDGREALEIVKAQEPRVVLMDLTMPGLSGLEATRRIRKAHPKTQVVILSVHSDEEHIARALESGAVGYLLKDIRAPELFDAIEAAAGGRRYLSPAVSEAIISAYLRLRRDRADVNSPFQLLTAREREILRLLTEGRSSKEIAGEISVSPKTVETHRANIMRKLDIHNIADLVRYAIARGIVEP
jgi:DNA-binding NarL/FixJ family response regulator